VVRRIHQSINPQQVNVLLGCGRMLGALVQYGSLDLTKIDYLVDNFLVQASGELYKKKLYQWKDLDQKHVDHVVLCTRSATQEVRESLRTAQPDLNITHVGDLLDRIINLERTENKLAENMLIPIVERKP